MSKCVSFTFKSIFVYISQYTAYLDNSGNLILLQLARNNKTSTNTLFIESKQ